ncbi:uncharacterized protein LOC127095659 [Lathyrus oleraceus]|uniref:uncharacterized protein LOC127095659 n=1 Tax=Pisum sativum TaxID=3888 RepID=UPI0021CEBE6F|nr:uncharacterized protein LOC127095659 [Pisum sativum]
MRRNRGSRAGQKSHNQNNESTNESVFTIRGVETSRADELIQGMCLVDDKLVVVLFDSGATHYFISITCVDFLKLEVVDLNKRITISTPSREMMVTCSVCVGCRITIKNRKFLVNLIVLPLHDLDVILEMDWLSANNVTLECKNKTITFGEDSGKVNKVKALTKKFMMMFSISVKEALNIENFPVVCEFPKVFLEDVPGLSLIREVEFSIDLVLGARPISISPYWMSPLELAELKKQLEKMLGKGVYHTKCITMGSSNLVYEKEIRFIYTLRRL